MFLFESFGIPIVLLWLFWLSVGADSVAVKFKLYPTGCKSIAIGLSFAIVG